MNFKNIAFFLSLTFSGIFSLNAQSIDTKLSQGDSLFNEKKYTQSFEIYKEILSDENKASPAMLLKMAYIKEGLGDYSSSLYYLNLFYLKTHNKRALKKMEDLADSHNLTGYKYTDFEFFMNIFYRYYMVFVISLGSLLFFLVVYMLYKRLRIGEKPSFSLFYMALIVTLLFYIVNFGKTYQKGIIIQPNAYLMRGPSAGSGLLSVVDQGHRVKILGKEDVWVKIKWDNDIAYIRENNIIPLTIN